MITEQEIKAALDGTFTTFRHATQEVRTKRVSLDYIPTHKPYGIYDEETAPVRGRQWTEMEDALICKMWEAGYTFKEMAKQIGGSSSAVNIRWQQICLKLGIQPTRRDTNEKFPAELYERIGHMKIAKRLTLRQIAREVNLTVNQVAGIWRRYKVNNDMMDEAA